MRLRWTLQAEQDLAGIKEFISRDSPTYALATARQLYHAAEMLVAFPESGRVVEILTIHHSSRPLPGSIVGGEQFR
jgi:plasmid stabilization system protein ParE